MHQMKITRCDVQHASISSGVQVKVVLRVSPSLSEGQGQPPVLRIDPSKKRVTVMEPISRSVPHATMTLDRNGKHLLKTINFDAAYPQESSQVRVQIHPDSAPHNSNMIPSVRICICLTFIRLAVVVLHRQIL